MSSEMQSLPLMVINVNAINIVFSCIVTDGQTDGHVAIAITRSSIALRG